MAPQHRPGQPLKIVTQRLAACSVGDLPLITPQLVDSLVNANDSFCQDAKSQKFKESPDFGVILHKFKTQLSSLLQDKTSAARWTAVVLVKTYIGLGGQDALESCGFWVRSMTSFLGQKSEHLAVKKAAVFTLVRIFLATKNHPSLKREVTTPALQPFITHCLNSTCIRRHDAYQPRPNSPLLRTVLQAFLKLMPIHPSSFRPFRRDIRSMLSPLLAPTASNLKTSGFRSEESRSVPSNITALAQCLLALLPRCAPHNAAADEWLQSLQATLNHCDRTANNVFRSIKEEHSTGGNALANSKAADIVGDEIGDLLDLPSWRGIDAGVERLVGCLQIVEAHLATTSSMALPVPVTSIWNMLERIMSVLPPSGKYQPETNPQIERTEREALWSKLAEIHEAALATTEILMHRMGQTSLSLIELVIEKLLILWDLASTHNWFRGVIYRVMTRIVSKTGQSMPEKKTIALHPVLLGACRTIEEEFVISAPNDIPAMKSKQIDSGSLLRFDPSKDHSMTTLSPDRLSLQATNAIEFLEAILCCIRSEYLPRSVRSKIDRAIILSQHKDAMLASTLNPQKKNPGEQSTNSILPFLVRTHPNDLAIESVLRPRHPVIIHEVGHGSAMDGGYQGSLDAVDMQDTSDNEDNQVPSYSNGPVQSPNQSFAKPLDTGSLNSPGFTADAALQSPKRARPHSPFQSWASLEQNSSWFKKARTEQHDVENPVETAEDKEPVITENGDVEHSETKQVERQLSPVPQMKSTVQDDGSERSITPELIIPSDFGLTTDEEEEDDDDDGENAMET